MVALQKSAACVFLKDQSGEVLEKPKVEAACVFLKGVEEKPEENLEQAACVFLKGEDGEVRLKAREEVACVFLKSPEQKPEQAACVFLKGEEKPQTKTACVFLKGDDKPDVKAACVFLKGGDDKAAVRPQLAEVAFFYRRLVAWDLSVMKAHAVRKGLFSADDIDAVELEYKRFMALGCAYGSNAAPLSQRVDDFWHAHILFTENYAAMCQDVAGQFLHHRPTMDEGEPSAPGRFKLYEASFGTPTKAWW